MRIAFCGAQGTGKSTLVGELLRVSKYSHYIRSINPQRLFKQHLNMKLNQEADYLTQISVASAYSVDLIQHEDYISDRALIDVFAYTKAGHVNSSIAEYIEVTFAPLMSMYDIIFYTPIEFTPPEDGTRVTDTSYQKIIDDNCKHLLSLYYPNFVTLSGSIENRVKTMLSCLNQLTTKE